MRAFATALAIVAAISACGGRAQMRGHEPAAGSCASDCGGSLSDAGSTSRGAAGGLEPPLGAAGSEAAGSLGIEGGAGGELANGGAPARDQGGTDNQGGSSVGGSCPTGQGSFATEVLSHSFGGAQNVNQTSGFPEVLFGSPVANDPSTVVSLGNGGWVVLGFGDNAIVDGPGVDFTVFENPLPSFKELAIVAVSDDAEHWTEFPCTAPQDATDFGFCAGVGVVFSSPKNGIDPLDPAVSGGDRYDLADIGVSHARYVRITDRVDLTGVAGVFDLDAVALIHGECR